MHYPEFPKQEINFLLNEGGLGDSIARMPAIKYISETHKHVVPLVWIPDFFYPVACNMLSNVKFKKFSQNKEYDYSLPARSTGARWFTNLKTHMVDHAFALLANEIPDIKYKNYVPINFKPVQIKKWNLPKKYVVVTTGFTAPIREFLSDYVNEVVNYCISKGYRVVFLGRNETPDGFSHTIVGSFRKEINFSKGINLIDKTNLLETAKILAEAKAVVGLDNGLLHLAACSDTAIVGAFTNVDPKHRLPIRNDQLGWNYHSVVPPYYEPERFCQSNWDFIFDHDFTESYYKNNDLIKSVTPDLYIEQLEKIL